MIDTDDLDNMSRRDLVELLEAYNESLAEVKRLREVNDDLICDLEGFQEAVKEDEAGYKDLVASLEGIEEELKAEVKRLREQLSKARNWVSDYFTDINGDYMTWEGRDLHADFIKELEMIE